MMTYTAARRGDATRLLVIGGGEPPAITTLGKLEEFLRDGDLLVLNESGTIPASLAVELERTKETLEIRLASKVSATEWIAVAFGEGDWSMPTENRGAPPRLIAGDALKVSSRLRATVKMADRRLIKICLEGEVSEIFRVGQPVQYSYHHAPLTVWDSETLVASNAWSVEAPSALFPLTAERLLALKRRFRVVTLLHGAGLSNTGDPVLDAQLPLPEPYWVPEETMAAVRDTRARGGRVVAWGTSAARALESAYDSGENRGIATLKLGPSRRARVVNGLISGFHDPETSHFQLECGLMPEAWVREAFRQGQEAGFLSHEYGDLVLLRV